MPYARTKRKKTYSRKPRAPRSTRKARSTRKVPRAPRSMDYTKPMPLQLNCKFKYVSEQKTLTTGVAGVAVHTYVLNSLFDPDFTGVGHQPYGFDQLTPFYRRYRVNGAKVTIRFFDQSTDGCRVGYKARNHLDLYATAFSTASEIRETPNNQIKVISSGGKASSKFVNKYFTNHVLNGVSKIKYAVDDSYAADVTASPVNRNWLDVLCSGPVDNTSGQNVKYTIEIVYYTTMYALYTQSPS